MALISLMYMTFGWEPANQLLAIGEKRYAAAFEEVLKKHYNADSATVGFDAYFGRKDVKSDTSPAETPE